MGNPLMQFMGGGVMSLPPQIGNTMQLLQQLNQFRNTFQGDPQKQVEQLRKSGQMTDAQYHQLEAMANQIMPLLK